ncbi:hypothetical protein QE152_g30447 [Popillia japonica]|uniref:Uncharacterized protein n=1 Tax=Popillia japonica TaxID=7064 RepID=A0AAW1JEM2_POPJA
MSITRQDLFTILRSSGYDDIEDQFKFLKGDKLSRYQYEVIRKKAPEKFPSYKVLQVAKQECYPKSDCIKVTSTSAEVSLQALLDHTMNRLISVQHRVVNELNNAELDKLWWNCHSETHINFFND